MHAYRAGGGLGRARVLYLFRSPANIRVGRKPLDAEVVEALEHTHPDLSFDWMGMLQDPAGSGRAFEAPDRGRAERAARRSARAPAAARAVPEAPVIALEDESLLGGTLGAREAARLRARYSELLQRIVRRAPTPEERDRLSDRLARLNPDEWADEAAIRAGAASVEADWDAIALELPRRRRGRRGGRRQDREPGASAIIGTETNQREELDNADDDLGEQRDAGGARDSGAGGAGERAPDRDAAAAGDAAPDPADAGLPDDR
jgi:hypothetical protein